MGLTSDEWMSVCISRQVSDGEVWAQGINTPLVMAGLILAKLTHAPNVRFASAIGQSLTEHWSPLSLTRVEWGWLEGALMHIGFAAATAELLPAYQPHEFFRPAQVDGAGNFNNLAIGQELRRPRMQLPGVGGIPDVTVQYDHVYLYVPRHARISFVPKLDYVTGLGHALRYLVTDLGEFDVHEGQLRLLRYFPPATPETIQRKTGFALRYAEACIPSPPPSAEELHLLREVIDPLGIRRLETLGGAARRAHLRAILAAEEAL